MRRPGKFPGRLKPRIALFAPGQPVGPVAPPPFWASASTSQVTLESWFIYDPTTGPVHPPSIDPKPLLLDTGIIQRRDLARALASETINAVGVATGEFLPQFVAQWSQPSDTFSRLLWKKPLPETVDVPRSPAVEVPLTLLDTGIVQQRLLGRALASSTTDVIFVPPPPIIQNLIDAPSDIRGLRPPRPFQPTSVVFAIPINDLWYEALDIPIRLKGKSFDLASSTADVIFQPGAVVPPPPQVLPDATVFARLKVKQILDESAAPVGAAPTLPPVPPPILGADWLESTIRVLSARKVLSDTIDAIFPYPPAPTPAPPPPPDHGAGHGRGHWRTDFGRYWTYRALKKKEDIKAELEELEKEVVPQETEQILRDVEDDALDQLTERSQRLIEAIEAATQKAKAAAAKRAFQAMQRRAIEVRRKLAEEEEEQAAWLLLHLL